MAPSKGILYKQAITYEEIQMALTGTDPVRDPTREIPMERRRGLPRADFLRALRLWPEYRDGVLTRTTFDSRIGTMHSTYIISIIHWLEENSSSPHPSAEAR